MEDMQDAVKNNQVHQVRHYRLRAEGTTRSLNMSSLVRQALVHQAWGVVDEFLDHPTWLDQTFGIQNTDVFGSFLKQPCELMNKWLDRFAQDPVYHKEAIRLILLHRLKQDRLEEVWFHPVYQAPIPSDLNPVDPTLLSRLHAFRHDPLVLRAITPRLGFTVLEKYTPIRTHLENTLTSENMILLLQVMPHPKSQADVVYAYWWDRINEHPLDRLRKVYEHHVQGEYLDLPSVASFLQCYRIRLEKKELLDQVGLMSEAPSSLRKI